MLHTKIISGSYSNKGYYVCAVVSASYSKKGASAPLRLVQRKHTQTPLISNLRRSDFFLSYKYYILLPTIHYPASYPITAGGGFLVQAPPLIMLAVSSLPAESFLFSFSFSYNCIPSCIAFRLSGALPVWLCPI